MNVQSGIVAPVVCHEQIHKTGTDKPCRAGDQHALAAESGADAVLLNNSQQILRILGVGSVHYFFLPRKMALNTSISSGVVILMFSNDPSQNHTLSPSSTHRVHVATEFAIPC